MPAIYVVAALVLYFVFLGDGNPVDGALTALYELERGSRLTHSPADSTGLVSDDPAALAAEAGLSEDVYSLARMISSEEGSQDTTTQAAIAWCAINTAHRQSTSVTALLLKAKNPRNSGSYGSEDDEDPSSSNKGHSDRYASTRQDPYQRDADIAQQCLDGTIPDMTGGATNFDRAGQEKNPDKVAANREKAGLVEADVEGTAEGLRFWRPA